MWALELEDTGYYLPKTPYTVEEIKNGYITNKPDRIGRYVHKKYVDNIKRDLGLQNWNVVFIEKQHTV
jgi:hypothetical protein